MSNLLNELFTIYIYRQSNIYIFEKAAIKIKEDFMFNALTAIITQLIFCSIKMEVNFI